MWELPMGVHNVSVVEFCDLGEVINKTKHSFTLSYFIPSINKQTGELNTITVEKITLISLTPLLVNI